MRVHLSCRLSDRNLDCLQSSSQRQLTVSIAASSVVESSGVPLNLCLVLDRSGSMGGKPLDTVKKAAAQLIDRLEYTDRLSIVSFNHKAQVVVGNQSLDRPEALKEKIYALQADGGTCIDDGIKLCLQEMSKGKDGTISQAFVLTDGENEHGNNDRCLQFAKLAAEYNMTLHTLGFGDNWNQDVLERIADAGGGTMSYIQSPEQAVGEFQRLLHRVQSVSLTNAHLLLELTPNVRLAELKPVAQVSPDAIELPLQVERNFVSARLGDLMVDAERIALVNFYVSHVNATAPLNTQSAPTSTMKLMTVQVRYDDPTTGKSGILSEPIAIEANLTSDYQPQIDPQVQNHILALAKYRQTQLAEIKLQQGDRLSAATLLQSAAKTALQMGDGQAATVLQNSATRLQAGNDLSESERKQTRIVSKTVLQVPTENP